MKVSVPINSVPQVDVASETSDIDLLVRPGTWPPVHGQYMCTGCGVAVQFTDLAAPAPVCVDCEPSERPTSWLLLYRLVRHEKSIDMRWAVAPPALPDRALDRLRWSTPPPGSGVDVHAWARYGVRLTRLLADARAVRSVPVMSISLPAPLLEDADEAAVDLLRSYVASAPGVTGGVAFTGSLFDTWAGGGGSP